mmetsp:Transcript_48477/g.128412  ORF Transcript_48477/g.128412 Transcript_48477/m.128412 type:complete len:108 (-) Transcript_48477:173-496(-)
MTSCGPLPATGMAQTTSHRVVSSFLGVAFEIMSFRHDPQDNVSFGMNACPLISWTRSMAVELLRFPSLMLAHWEESSPFFSIWSHSDLMDPVTVDIQFFIENWLARC